MPPISSRLSRSRRRRGALVRLLLSASLIAGGFSGTDDVASANHAPAPDVIDFTLTPSDLEFILRQIKIAEAHAAGGQLFGPGPNQISSPQLPFGLRTVTGEFNNIIPGQTHFGATDLPFPRLTTPLFRSAEDFDPDGPGPAPATATSYAQTSGLVADSHPRVVSNLIVDQTGNNPAAAAAAAGHDGSEAVDHDNDPATPELFVLPNRAPDEGLSAPFNSWFTLFGQFFDHGLDLVTKGNSGIVVVPLQPDDPLFVPGSPTNFMVLTRATNLPGNDGIVGTADDIHEHTNTTTPFVDQNQTYTSHPAHQVFLREYALNGAGRPVSTGRMLDGADGGLANWAEVKAQAASLLGIQLSDLDALNVPLLATDPYGKFLPGPNGRPRIVKTGNTLVEGGPGVTTANAIGTGHAFLDDIAHHAVPFGDHDNNPSTPRQPLTPDGDSVAGPDDRDPATYDNELLDRHFITGDGRGNENIGLTAVHHVFHAEHNRLVEHVKDVVGTTTPGFIAEWQLSPGVWNGERIFQAAKFVTEMEYQHLVFEEFARKVQPQVNVFVGHETDINPAIVAEFAHTVYRFGHSMLTETVARTNADGTPNDVGLIEAFLNPLALADGGTAGTLTPEMAVGAIVRGMTRQVGNEIDEFVTEALRNNLLGLPLDLPTINITRGRDTGVPPLNSARREFFAATSDGALRPYESWSDFEVFLRHPESLVNFVAAYGTHETITSATTLAERRAAADLLVNGGTGAPADRLEFLDSTGAWARGPGGVTVTGLDNVDFWVGGLAERTMPFGGLLGSTFNYVFETQLEKLQDGDRLYYLHRLAGLNLLTQLEQNSFAELIMRTTDATHLPADVFSRPDFTFEVAHLGGSGAVLDDPSTPEWNESTLLSRLADGTIRFSGGEHVLFGGTEGVDRIRSGDGDDTIWGDGGNDRLEGGAGNDQIMGGNGDDIIQDLFGDDNIKGGSGHDAINAGQGFDLILGGAGNDFVVGGSDPKEVFAGAGNDFVHSGDSEDIVFGDEGSDWLEGGNQADLIQGEHGAPFQDDASPGHDVIIGGGGNDDFDSEGGDDVMVTGPGIERNEGMLGFDWVTHRLDPQPAVADMRFTGLLPPDLDNIRDRFDNVEGLSGWEFDDVLRGDDTVAAQLVGHELRNVGLITGLQALLGPGTVEFSSGNILLGGRGSDIIEGRGGDDLIDGDAWLNVRISVRDAANPAVEIRSANTMSELAADIFAGRINPGQLRIVREILTPPGGTAVDTAVFSDVSSSYTVTTNTDGSVTVAHVAGTLTDGTDTLRNIERLRFADTTVALVAGNTPATGTVVISDTTPAQGQVLTATPDITDPEGFDPNAVTLTWQASDAAPDGWVPVGTGNTFTPGPAQVGQALRVVATFVDNAGVAESVWSPPTALVSGAADTIPPSPPQNVVAEGTSQSEISLSWAPSTDNVGVVAYRIFRDASPTPLTSVTGTSFIDSGLAPGSTHSYVITAVDAAGNTASSAPTSATTLTAPAPVATLIPTAVAFGDQNAGTTSPPREITIRNDGPAGSQLTVTDITLTGTPTFNVASDFCGPLPRVLGPGASCAVAVTFSPPTAGSHAGSLVFSHDAAGGVTTVPLSGNGVAVTAPATPTGLAAVGVSTSEIQLTWDAVPGATSYRIFRDGFDTTPRATTTNTILVDGGMPPDTFHTYKVAAVNSVGQSPLSAKVGARTLAGTSTTVPATPTGLSGIGISTSEIRLTWNAVPGATSYRIFRDGSSTARITTSNTTVVDGGMPAGTTHTYKVAAVNSAGQSPLSSKAVASTLADLSITPSSVDYGNVAVVGATSTRTFTVRNNRTVSSTINSTSLGGTNPGQFSIASNGCLNVTLPAGGTCTFNVVFNPSSTGVKTATVRVTRSGSTTQFTATLRGTGV